ncbi:hypothetical protein ABIB66_001040 [Bradyrhizobium sp. F1.13.3]
MKRAEKLQAKGNSVDFNDLLRMEPDSGITNIRNVKSKHWTLGVENRCAVSFNSFSEFNKAEGGDIWFALNGKRRVENDGRHPREDILAAVRMFADCTPYMPRYWK